MGPGTKGLSVAVSLHIRIKLNKLMKVSFQRMFNFIRALAWENENSGGDALRGNTRKHPEHDG